jgi:hypothetical protein
MTRHTHPISRLSSFGTPHVRRFFAKLAIRPFIYTFSPPNPLFPSSAHPACLTTPFTITASPFPIERPLSPTFYQTPTATIALVHAPLHLVIIRPILSLVPALAHPLPCVCHRLASIPLLYISSLPSTGCLAPVTPFGPSKRQDPPLIGSSADYITSPQPDVSTAAASSPDLHPVGQLYPAFLSG